MGITYRQPDPPKKDANGEFISMEIFENGNLVGHYRQSKFSSGFFVCVYGTKWQNAPGARYPQELDARTDYTYVKSRRAIEPLVKRVLEERALAQRRQSD